MVMNKKEASSALVFMGMGVIILVALHRDPVGTLAAPDMAFFPVVLSILLIILSLILIGRSMNETWKKPERLLGAGWPKLVPVIASLIAYTFLFEPLGYVLCTALLLILVGKLANCSWKVSILISLICTFFSYAVFGWYLHIPLPSGVLPL